MLLCDNALFRFIRPQTNTNGKHQPSVPPAKRDGVTFVLPQAPFVRAAASITHEKIYNRTVSRGFDVPFVCVGETRQRRRSHVADGFGVVLVTPVLRSSVGCYGRAAGSPGSTPHMYDDRCLALSMYVAA